MSAEPKMPLNHKILEYCLYILVFLLPWQTRWMAKLGELNGGYWEYGTYSVYGVDILLLGLLLFWFIGWKFFGGQMSNQTPISNNQKIQYSIFNIQYFWLVLGLLELFIFISIFFAYDWKLALYGYGRFLLGVGLFWLLTRIHPVKYSQGEFNGVKFNKTKLYWSIVAAGVLQSCLAIQQFITQSVFGNKWLGMAAQKAQDLGVSVVEAGDERWLRAYGSLPHPNILGGFLAIVLLVNIILYFNLRRNWQAGQNAKQNKKYKFSLPLSLIFFTINFAGLLLTFSRTAWLAFATGFVVLLILNFSGIGRRDLQILPSIMWKFIFIIIVAGGLFFCSFREPIMGRVSVDGRLENKSIVERANYNKEAWQIIKKHWLFGTGIKNYGLAVYNEIDNSQPAYSYQPVHNVFLLVWAETGIFGLISLIVILLNCYIVSWRAKQNFEAMALLTAIVVMMLFDHWLWSLNFGVLLWWLVVSFAVNSGVTKENIF